MEKDERLLPLPNAGDLQMTHQDVAAGYSPFYDDNFTEGRSTREYFLVVYKRLPLILALTILATAATALYMYRQPSIYEATTEMVMEPRQPKMETKEAVTINNFGNDTSYYNTQLKLLEKPELMREVVVRLSLQRDPNLLAQQNKGFIGSLRSMFSSDKSLQNKDVSLPTLSDASVETASTITNLTPEEKIRADAYADYLIGGLHVEQVPTTNLVNIKVQNSNPDLAAKVADSVASTFIEQDTRREVQGAEQIKKDLEKSLAALQVTINQQQQELINSMKNGNLPLASKGEELAFAKLQTMNTQWLTAAENRRKAQALYESAAQASQKGELPSVMPDDKTIQQIQNLEYKRQADLEARLLEFDKQIEKNETDKAALLVKYTPEYPEVKKIDATISTLKEKRANALATDSKRNETEIVKTKRDVERQTLTNLQAQLASAQKSEAQAYELLTRETAVASQQGLAATRLTTLSREIETNRKLYDDYTQRLKEQELAISRSRPDNVYISNFAQKPESPIGPNRNRNIIVAFLLSLAAGIGLAFLFDYLDDSIKTSDDVGKYLGLPTLALIPHQNTVKRSKGVALTPRNATSNALISLEDARSSTAEAYRHLRTSLLFSSAGKPPQVILITSSQPSEGKTTTAINTAITLSQSGAEVVIIDCDLRRPRLHNHFDLENTSGLTNYLSGDRNPENLLKSYPGLPNLKIMTSGPIPPNPAELLSSNEMKNLLQYLKGNFKHVVIDSPPAVSFTDAAILSTLVDGVVLVAMAGRSSLHLMRRFKQRLGSIGARIYGVVINGIKPSSIEYGYYGYGYTYSYYDAPEDDETPRMEE